MKIAVIGAGGVGGYLGALLIEAGHDVHFIARGRHRSELRASGLAVDGVRGDFVINHVQVTGDPSTIGPCDVVVLAVRQFAAEAAAALIGPLLGPDTQILTLQNGIDAPYRLSRRVGASRVLAGGAYVAAHIRAPGLIEVGAPRAVVEIAPVAGVLGPLAAEFVDIANGAGIETSVRHDADVVLWRKLCLVAAFAGIGCLYRRAIGAMRDDPVTYGLLVSAVAEAAAVARAAGVALAEGTEAEVMAALDGLPRELRPSMLVDLEHGRPLEVMELSGAVIRLAALHGVAAPLHGQIVERLEGLSQGREARSAPVNVAASFF